MPVVPEDPPFRILEDQVFDSPVVPTNNGPNGLANRLNRIKQAVNSC